MRSLLAATLVAPALAALLFALPGGAAEEVVDGVAAQVGSDIVLLSEVTGVARGIEPQLREMGASTSDLAQMRADILESLIERRLIEQVVRRSELGASDAEVNETIASIARENGLTLEQLRASVEGNELSYEAYRERIRGEIERAKAINLMVRSRVRVDPGELRNLYEQRYGSQPQGGEELHIRHLLVTARKDQTAACAKVEAARARVLAGESFESVAARVSEANPASGGDVGWVHERSLASWMAPVVRALEPGGTSEVVKTPFGCNLLHLVERRRFSARTFEEARPELFDEVFDRRFQDEYAAWMETLRGQTYIERRQLFARGPSEPTPPVAGGAAESGTP